MQELKNPQAAEAAHAMVKAILFYGGIMFATGFFFGVLREIVFIPLAGKRAGHWIEFPLMIGATLFWANRVAHRLHDARAGALLGLGICATILLLAIESGFALYVLRMPLQSYLAGFDVTEGALFPYGLAVMALAPLAMHRMRNGLR